MGEPERQVVDCGVLDSLSLTLGNHRTAARTECSPQRNSPVEQPPIHIPVPMPIACATAQLYNELTGDGLAPFAALATIDPRAELRRGRHEQRSDGLTRRESH